MISKRVTYHGLAAHAAASPERGRNALNAVIRLFVGVDGWRQHLPEGARVHGIITKGGTAYNVVPQEAEALFGLRARQLEELREMIATFEEIAQGAALQTGTRAQITDEMRLYEPMKPNPVLADVLRTELERQGLEVRAGGMFSASTDLGNVSQRVPTDAIEFPISPTTIAGHSHVFRESALTEIAHENAFRVIEALASAVRRIATEPELRQRLAV